MALMGKFPMTTRAAAAVTAPIPLTHQVDLKLTTAPARHTALLSRTVNVGRRSPDCQLLYPLIDMPSYTAMKSVGDETINTGSHFCCPV